MPRPCPPAFAPFSVTLATLVFVATGCAASLEQGEALGSAQIAEAQALLPADAKSRQVADRAEPITRATFWAIEYEKTPENLPTTLSYLDALQGISSHKKVVEVAAAALPLHPISDQLLTVFGRSLMKLDRYEDAAEAYRRAGDLNPANAGAFSGLGTAYDRLGRHRLAQPAYRKALALDPNRLSARSNLGLSLALTGDIEAAAEQLEIAAELPGANAVVRQNLALILGLKGDFGAARAIAEIDASPERVDENLSLLREVATPARSWERLEAAGSTVEGSGQDREPTRRLRGGFSGP